MRPIRHWRRLVVVVPALLVATLVLGGVASGESKAKPTFTLLVTVEHTGDEIERGFTFVDRIVSKDGDPVDGWDGGRCINLDPDPEELTMWMCELVFRLPEGDITAAGPVDFSAVFAGETIVFAVTGGTGDFRNVRGELEVVGVDELTALGHFWLRGAGG